ncbi:sensor histidine kinase [Nocardia pseudovaccinii]|uniref:sensor histidine kinase n=1 Tax=Nocardia pseudovaccinii TaxID=189540 RepID=UPI003D94D7C5
MNKGAMRVWSIDLLAIVIAAADVALGIEGLTPVEVVLAMTACLGLVLRRRWPLVTYLLTLPGSWIMPMVAAPAVALYTLAEQTRTRWSLGACVVATALAAAAPQPLNDITDHADTLIIFVYLLAFALAPVLLGQLVQTKRDLSLRLEEIEQARTHERQLHAQAVLARERAQIGREMHDVVSHQVSLIAVRAGALQVVAKDPDTEEAARTIRRLSVATLDELRHMVTLLRVAGGRSTDITPQPTLADLRALLDTSGIPVALTGSLSIDTDAPTQRAIYRTVQEALTNIRKHAPGATATVHVWHDSTNYGVTITNTPPTRPALPLPGAHHGLLGLAERAELLNGSFASAPTSEGGYVVELLLPR